MADTKKIKMRKIRKNVAIAEDEKRDVSEKVTVIAGNKELTNHDSINGKKKRKVKSKKIRMTYTDKEEKELDKAIENEDNLSIMVMVIVLALCFIVGISLGYVLYRIAINSSNAMMIVRYFLN